MKRNICILLSVIILSSLVSVSAFAEEVKTPNTASAKEAQAPIVVLSQEVQDAQKLLKGLGFIDSDIISKQTISRGEFAIALVRILGIEGSASNNKQIFSDVPSSNPAFGAVGYLYSCGYIDATKGVFKPDDPIIYAQACKLLVCILGYNVMAINKGGYPSGYYIQAKEIGLLKSISSKADSNIMGSDFAILLQNAIGCDILQSTGFGDKVTYKVLKGENLLNTYHKIYLVEGIVTATTKNTLNQPNKSVFDDRIEIDKISYMIENNNLDTYLGYHVKAYYRENNDIKTIVTSVPYKTSVVTINAKDIDHFNANESKVYYFDANGIQKQYSVEKAFDFLYNGIPDFDYTETDFKPENGNITLIDNNSDGVYDVVMVRSVNYLVVSTVTEDGLVIDKNGAIKLDLSPDNNEIKKVIYVGNQEIGDISNINPNSIIVAVVSKDGKYIEATICNTTIEGTITEKEQDYIYIDKVKYKISNYYNQYYSASLGTKGTFAVADNILVANLEPNDALSYGYALAVGKKGGIGNIQMKLLTADGKITIYDLSDKITLDGVSYTPEYSSGSTYDNSSLLYKLFNTTKKVNGVNTVIFKYQLIKFRFSSGKINEIDTDNAALYISSNNAVPETPGYLPNIADSNNSLKPLTSSYSNARFDAKAMLFGDSVKASGAAVFFRLPIELKSDYYTANTLYSFEDKDFGAGSSQIRDGNNIDYKAYDVNEIGISNAFVYYLSDKGTLEYSSPIMVVDRVTSYTDKDGNIDTKVYYWTKDGRFYTAILPSNVLDNTGNKTPIGAGDILFYNISNKEITNYAICFKYSAAFPNDQYNSNYKIPTAVAGATTNQYIGPSSGAEQNTLFGVAYLKTENMFSVKDQTDGTIRLIPLGSGKAIIFDIHSHQIRPATFGDIVTSLQLQSSDINIASKVFVKRYGYFANQFTVIYK